MERLDIIGSRINAINMQELLRKLKQKINEKKATYICISNVHTTVMGRQDQRFRRITNDSFIAAPDGMPLVWVCKLMGNKNVSRCSGPDLMSEVFSLSEKEGYTHYFYGGTEDALHLLGTKLAEKYPKLKILGLYSPPFRTLTDEEDKNIITEINQLAPDIIWVGLGAPKQEIWMSEHIDKINSSIMIGVGAAFNFHSGTVKRAPVWMQKAGLEWLWRLAQEPGRLWKRYLTTNGLFVYYLLKEKLWSSKRK